MIKKLQQLNLFQQIISGLGVFIVAGIISSSLTTWRTQEVQGSNIQDNRQRIEKLENTAITVREYLEFKDYMKSQFELNRILLQENKTMIKEMNAKFDKHLQR